MRRFGWLLLHEVRLFRTGAAIHLVAIVQPTVLYLLMAVILVHPTFEMYLLDNGQAALPQLTVAMPQIGSPIGSPYIDPILVEPGQAEGLRQVVRLEEQNGQWTAVQQFGLVDSNLVKNFRNRLTAAALLMWNRSLGEKAVNLVENPWLPQDMPYTLYFGLAALPLTAALGASILGGMLTAQEFENKAIREYRLATTRPGLILAARLTRLVLTSMLSTAVLLVAIGLQTGHWPASAPLVFLILAPASLAAACLGVSAGLALRRSIPSFLVGLLTSFVGWILGSAFGLAGHFGGPYEALSRLTPNTHAVELLFPLYFGVRVGNPAVSITVLCAMCALMLALVIALYRRAVLRQR